MKLYEQTIYQFKEINPEKKFSRFSFTDVEWNEINAFYCCDSSEVLRIDGKFYMSSKPIINLWSERKPSIIRFKSRSKIVKEITV